MNEEAWEAQGNRRYIDLEDMRDMRNKVFDLWDLRSESGSSCTPGR